MLFKEGTNISLRNTSTLNVVQERFKSVKGIRIAVSK